MSLSQFAGVRSQSLAWGEAMKRTGCMTPGESAMKRRDFIRFGSLSLLGITLSQYLELRHLMARAGGSTLKIEPRHKLAFCCFWKGVPATSTHGIPSPPADFERSPPTWREFKSPSYCLRQLNRWTNWPSSARCIRRKSATPRQSTT